VQCYNPRLAFRRFDNTKIQFTRLSWNTYIINPNSNKPQLKQQYNTLFSKHQNVDLTQPLKIPCSKCEACTLNRAGETAKRAYHEYKSQKSIGMFLTLTYTDNFGDMPICGHFFEKDVQDFIKRLRKISPYIRTLGVAEYGETKKRAHYHILILGYEFPDKKIERETDSTHTGNKYKIYSSKTLTKLWNKGITEFGTVTEQSCSYVARYLYKKNKKEYYGEPCSHCKNPKPLKSKIICRSRRPGLGATYCDKFITESRIRASQINDCKESFPRYYINRVNNELKKNNKTPLTQEPDFTRIRENERKERLDAQKIIDKNKFKHLYRK